MNAKAESGDFRMDGLKWLVVLALIIGAAFGNDYFGSQPLIVRVLGMVAVAGVAAFVAFNTAKGHAFWTLAKEAQIEIRKVVWPTPAETNQTTLLVSVVVVITAMILWVFDWGIGQVAKMVLGS